MKLEKILDNLNSFEKNSFLKIIDGILSENPKNEKLIDKILLESDRNLKNMDNINIVKVFHLVKEEFTEFIKGEFVKTSSQFDILIDIITRDGNCIMKENWLAKLYDSKISNLKSKISDFENQILSESSELPEKRQRDYKIYRSCVRTAYQNDDLNNQERKITSDELSILITLSNQLGLSQEETKLINYSIVPIQKHDIELVISDLKSIGVIFFSKKHRTIYVADEMVLLLRRLRGKEVADKFFRRVLRLMREPLINQICREHSINWKLPYEIKIQNIISEGISFSEILKEDIHKSNTTLTEKKRIVKVLCDKKLDISPPLGGVLLEDKIQNLINYFEEVERDEKVGISIDGYEKLLIDLGTFIPSLNESIRTDFQLQEEKVLKSHYLLDYNIKPRDVLEVIPKESLKLFCKEKEINSRGNLVLNILDGYKDAENLYLENYENIGFRNISALKENGIPIKESKIGIKFEELTKKIFEKLGFIVDEEIRKKINTRKDKIDIVINLGKNDLILVECKTVKESGYNKFSTVSRQLKSYANIARTKGYKVAKSLLIAPDFSDEFIKDCGLEYELNLSLISASSLIEILQCFKETKLKKFPHNLFMRDVLIQEERVIKAITK
jgi:hypothetical protein